MNRLLIIGRIQWVMLFVFFLVILGQGIGITLKSEVIYESCKNEAENQDYKYCVFVKKDKKLFKTDYIVWIAVEGNVEERTSYGYLLNYPHNIVESDKINVDWSDDGVNITTQNGVDVFIPEANYLDRR